MPQSEIIYENLRVGEDGYLAGVLGYPARGNPTVAVLICSPHPNFGGDMENNVVAALAEGLAIEAITLRFDYRGVGQSRIDLPAGQSVFDYWEGIEDTLNYADPLADTAAATDELALLSGDLPTIAVGYSFGAIMATSVAMRDPRIVAMAGISAPLKRVGFEHLKGCRKPCLLVSAMGDFVFDAQAAHALLAIAGSDLTLEQPVGDHFFVGTEASLVDRIARFVRHAASPVSTVAHDGSK